ncbi:hypothetical protein [Methylomonas fluvii]|nr:hypothetical protein [Methylomonas fluvii]
MAAAGQNCDGSIGCDNKLVIRSHKYLITNQALA